MLKPEDRKNKVEDRILKREKEVRKLYEKEENI